jgi:hypothetical protein
MSAVGIYRQLRLPNKHGEKCEERGENAGDADDKAQDAAVVQANKLAVGALDL